MTTKAVTLPINLRILAIPLFSVGRIHESIWVAENHTIIAARILTLNVVPLI